MKPLLHIFANTIRSSTELLCGKLQEEDVLGTEWFWFRRYIDGSESHVYPACPRCLELLPMTELDGLKL
jgi:hypothetical protein